MITRTKWFAAAGLAVLALCATPTIAQAAPVATATPAGGDAGVADMERFLDEQGYAEDVSSVLLDKWLNEQLWDSMNGSEPVSIFSEDVDGFTVTTETYADGSINSVGVEIPAEIDPNVITPMAAGEVSGCRQTSTGYNVEFRSCKIRGVVGFVTMNATAGYNNHYRGPGVMRNVSIAAFDNCGATVFGGSWSQLSCGNIRTYASANMSALARFSANVNVWGDSHTATLEFYVNKYGTPSAKVYNNQ